MTFNNHYFSTIFVCLFHRNKFSFIGNIHDKKLKADNTDDDDTKMVEMVCSLENCVQCMVCGS